MMILCLLRKILNNSVIFFNNNRKTDFGYWVKVAGFVSLKALSHRGSFGVKKKIL
jgi:hypothetical protein